MYKLIFISLIALVISACGSQPHKPVVSKKQSLIAALIAKDRGRIIAEKAPINLSNRNNNIINLYLLVIADEPYKVLSHSQQIIKNFHHYNNEQQRILKPLILWAYAHPIYRQETSQQVRLLQRESLLVAPSQVDFTACETQIDGCANTLREQVLGIVAPFEFTEFLTQMANNDPCINLTQENVGGEAGDQCLASRKGSLKINLLSKPTFLFQQWQAMLESVPKDRQ